ncbi:hypothetical protein [Paenibacillus sp. 481]|uniref:hypothetical protein n=1 Tax=Paenibacillus sp. 481 TaxID=2835869 RepID=UPI001E51F1DB|nr:hypothetical protein [Paenibacillus sp. 481]UHA74206.1 hypothetical protein KIK04_03440 [Paenibacillus sp. 481]
MSRYMKQMIGIMILVVLGIFIGMEMANTGIERVYGPLPEEWKQGESRERQEVHKQQERANERMSVPERGFANGRYDGEYETGRTRSGENEANGERGERGNSGNSETNGNGLWLPPAEQAPVDKLADQTAGLLQSISQAGMQAIVGLFGSIF